MTASRRSVLKGAGAAAATGVVGSSLLGQATAAPVESLDKLSTNGNMVVDESGSPVQINGANLVDPSRSYRSWRGKTVDEMFDMATNNEWDHNMIRLPCQPQDIAGGRTKSDTTNDSMLGHGDNWGAIKPGSFDDNDLEQYFTDFVDPVVEKARENNVYVLIDYHTHLPIFHQQQFAVKEHRGIDFWQSSPYNCGKDTDNNWDWDQGMCGHRGYMWHGPDQIADIKSLPDNQEKMDDPDQPDPWFDPWAGADGGEDLVGQELETFWTFVANKYGGDSTDHVVFDIFNEPTGPYLGEWGAPDRMPGGGNYAEGDSTVTDARAKPYWKMFLERSKPWLNIAEENAPGRFMTIGNPRWSQWTYWASEMTYNGVNGTDSIGGVNAENIAYTAHTYVQEDMRPLQDYFGEPAKKVPVTFDEFGWEYGGGPDWFTHLGGTTEVWGEGDPAAIEKYGRPEGKANPNDLSEGEEDQMNYFEMDPDDPDKLNPEDIVGFREFFENSGVHPFAWCFDHTWAPRFFSDEDTDNWQLMPYSDTPGQWWQKYVQDHGQDAPPGGDNSADDIPGLEPNPDDGSEEFGASATDPDGDGLYEDVNGNEQMDFPDVNALFQNTSETNNAKFDFDGDGDVDMQDVLALFEMV